MAQVDSRRFLSNFSALFAPKIRDGQNATFYLDSSANSYTIQADNVFIAGGSSLSSAEVKALSEEVQSVSRTAQSVLTKCSAMLESLRSLSGLITQVETLVGDSEGQADFNFAYLVEDIRDLQDEVADLSASNNDSYDSDSYSVELLRYELDDLYSRVDSLTSQPEEYEQNVNYQFISGSENNV